MGPSGTRRPRARRDRALALVLRGLAASLSLVSWSAAQRFGRWLGALGSRLARRDRRRVLEHLTIAFPEWTPERRQETARACFRHLGETLGEFLWAFGRPRGASAAHITIEGWENLQVARAGGRPLIVVSGHVGAWELVHGAMAQAGQPLSVIARPLEEAALDRVLVRARAHLGTETISRGSPTAARQMLRAGRAGGTTIGLMIDQDTKVDGTWVPFFGRPAYTPTAAAVLARRLRARIVPVMMHRQADGSHRLRIEPSIVVGELNDQEITAQLTARIESWIRERPEQWVWMHRRWRRQPPSDPSASDPSRQPQSDPSPSDPSRQPPSDSPPSDPSRQPRDERLHRTAAGGLALGLLWTAALAVGCSSPERRSSAGGAWRRTDLLALTPVEETQPPNRRAVAGVEVSFLGAAEVRDLARVPEEQRRHFPEVSAGQVRALRLSTQTRIAYRVDLGGTPYLRFTPLGGPMPALYRVSVRPPGDAAVTEVHRGEVEPLRVLAPAVVEVDLARWSGQTVDLLLEVDGMGGRPAGARPEALWASPQVWSRRPVPPPPGPGRSGAAPAPNVLLIGLDTLRADFVGPRAGGAPSLTPALDRLATEGEVWTHAYSNFNVTNPSFASILTGLFGKNHGVYDLQTRLGPEHTTLAEVYRDAGYGTLAVFSASHLGDHASGLGQGFETVVTATRHQAAELAAETAIDWIDAQTSAPQPRPFFAFVHFFDPHTPHTPPAPYAEGLRLDRSLGLERESTAALTPFRTPGPRVFGEGVLAGHNDLYAGEVAYLDRQLDRLIDFLRSRGLLDSTLVAVVSDHGENLDEHGFRYRHIGLWETTTHVPLLVRWPADRARSGGAQSNGARSAGARRAGLVQTLDLFPTLLAACGLTVPPNDGIDLRQLTGDGRAGRAAVFAEHSGALGEMVRTRDRRLVVNRHPLVAGSLLLFRLAEDPAELRNLAGQGDPEEDRLRRLLEAWRTQRPQDPRSALPANLSSEQLEQLRALGYL